MVALLAVTGCGPFLEVPDPVLEETGGDTEVPIPIFFPLEEHKTAAPWGISIELLDISGGSGPLGQFQVGDTPTMVFYVEDFAGTPYHPSQLSGMDIQVAGPSNHMAIVYDRSDIGDVLEDVEAVEWVIDDPEAGPTDVIAWSFTFPTPIPENYSPAPNDTPDIGFDVGDWGGTPIVDGSYAFAVWGYVRHFLDTGTEVDGSSDTEWELFGAAETIEVRERVLLSNCAKCHGEPIESHGGTRTGGLDLCIMCHIQGAEDRWSQEDQLTTPGTTVFMPVMIHKIHMGANLTEGYEVNGHPATPFLPGYPDYNTHSFDDVNMPIWPNGVGACHVCHGGAAQGDEIQALAARNPCGACHDNIVWATGVNHDDGRPATDDATCGNTGCHPASQIKLDHLDPRIDPAQNPGIQFEILGVSGGSGSGGQFQIGDALSVEYTALHDDGSEIDATADISWHRIKMTGPLHNMQLIFEDSISSTTLIHNIVDKSYTYTTTKTVPATYPAQLNNTSDIGFEEGDWVGLDLESGTYRVSVSGYIDIVDDNDETLHIPASAVYDVLVGSAVRVDEKEPVDEARCLDCHQVMWAHGDQRGGVRFCPMCHTPGAEDRASGRYDPEVTPGVTIEFSKLIHKIHNGSELSETFDVAGFAPPPTANPPNYTIHNFNEVVYPWFEGGTAHCESCHGAKYKTASGRVCLSCHDTALAASHVALNTDAVWGESCDVCHGPGRSSSVEAVHHQHHAATD